MTTFTHLNLLEAKKQLDNLRVRQTDKIDVENYQNRKPTYMRKEVHQKLRDLSQFYHNLLLSLRIALTKHYKSLLLNWDSCYRHQLENNIDI